MTLKSSTSTSAKILKIDNSCKFKENPSLLSTPIELVSRLLKSIPLLNASLEDSSNPISRAFYNSSDKVQNPDLQYYFHSSSPETILHSLAEHESFARHFGNDKKLEIYEISKQDINENFNIKEYFDGKNTKSTSVILIKIQDYSLAFPTTVADFFAYFPLSFHNSQKFYSQTAVFYKKSPFEPSFKPIKSDCILKKGPFFERSSIFKLGIADLNFVELIGNVTSEKLSAWDDAYYCCFESDFRPFLLFYTCDNSEVIQGKISNENMNIIDCYVGNNKSYGQDLAKKQLFDPFEVVRMLDDDKNEIKVEEDVGKDVENELEKAFERLEKEKICIKAVGNKEKERIIVELKEEKNIFAVVERRENIIGESKEVTNFFPAVEEEKILPKDNEPDKTKINSDTFIIKGAEIPENPAMPENDFDKTKINSDTSIINEAEIPENPAVPENDINIEQRLVIEAKHDIGRISPIPEDTQPKFCEKPLYSPQKFYHNQDTNNESDSDQIPIIPSFKVVEFSNLIRNDSFNNDAEQKKEESKNTKNIHQKTPESKYISFIGTKKKTPAEKNEQSALETHNHFRNNLPINKKTSSCSSSEASINTSYSHTQNK